MKKLSINKLNEYPAISLEEQMMLKGGADPVSIVLGLLSLGIGFYQIYQSMDDEGNEETYIEKNGSKVSINTENIQFLRVDSVTNQGIYGLEVGYYPD